MKPPTALAAALLLLSEGLDDPDTDATGELLALGADAARAVSSYLGLTVVAPSAAAAVSMTIPPDTGVLTPIQSSLRIEIHPQESSQSVSFTLYAAHPGAFVDLAADLAFLLDLDLTDVALDEQLSPPAAAASVAEWSQINQAIGVLIDRGHLPRQAQHLLGRDAEITLAAAAARVLASLND